MKKKIDKAWGAYYQRWVLMKWYAEKYPSYVGLTGQSRINSRMKFQKYVCKLIGENTTFEWLENGDCLVAGIVYCILIA